MPNRRKVFLSLMGMLGLKGFLSPANAVSLAEIPPNYRQSLEPNDCVRDPIMTDADCASDWRIEIVARANCLYENPDELTGALVINRSISRGWVSVSHDHSLRVPVWWNGIDMAKLFLEKLDAAGVQWKKPNV